ncbi:MAG: DUF484 family protein [Alphaproteobacteria bacterium]
MSQTSHEIQKLNKEITDQDIIAYLRENPDFAEKNPNVLDLVLPSKKRPRKGDIADFQSYMIERLKADKKDVIESTKEIVENARSNMNNQQRVHRAVLRLLEARNFEDFIHCITMDLASLLDVDISVLLIESDGSDIPHIHQNGIRILPEDTIDNWMEGRDVRLQDNISGIEAVYGGAATLVQSQVLLRLDIAMGTPTALLAFGSRDPNAFIEGQATDQVLFLAHVIERSFRSWLNLPI